MARASVRAGTAASDRWAARPVLGASVRLLALLGPVVVGLLTAVLLSRAVPRPDGGEALLAWWAAVLLGSAAAVFACDRLARRLLPLAVLLELSLLFPDRAPSRLRAVRTSSVRDLDARLARLRGDGVAMEPYEAAETVVTLVGILGLHDKRTRGHSERVRAFTDLLTAELRLDEDARMRLRWAALVHDLGKLEVPATVLNATGGLDEEAWTLLRRHPDEGVRLLGGLLPWLGEWGDAVAHHHERWDGTGYPHGLAGEQISLAGRIVALADSFEVITSARSYKAARSAAAARAELTRCAGSQFDPALVRAFLGISLGRLRWVLGPVTWLAELPFVATADRAGQTVKVASVTALAAGVLATGAPFVPPPAAPYDAGVPVAGSATGTADPDADDGAPSGTTSRDADAASTSPRAADAPAAPDPPTAVAPGTGAPALALDGRSGRRSTSGRTGQPPARPADAAPGAATQPAPGGGAGAAPAPERGPVAAPPALHLSRGGLVATPPESQERLQVPLERPQVFDHRLTRPLVLPEVRDLVLHVRFPTRQGNAKIAVRLLDCPATPGAECAELSLGGATQDKASTTEFTAYEMRLLRSGTSASTLAAGRVLRLEVVVREPGAKAPAVLALGSAATPSRLLLSAG